MTSPSAGRRNASASPWLPLAVLGLATLGLAACGSSDGSSSSSTNPVTMSPANGSTLPDGTVGSVYSQTFSVASGGTAPYTFIPNGLPGGLSVTSNNTFSCTLSGTPTTSGTGTVSLQVIDDASQKTDLSYVLTIQPAAGSSLSITPASLGGGTLGASYATTLSVSNGVSPYSWTVSGTLPPGLGVGSSSSASNTITGTPTTKGTYSFGITVSDGSSSTRTVSQSYSITIS